jgi:ribosome maturation factor RimP
VVCTWESLAERALESPELDWLSTVERTVTGLGYDLVDTERGARGLLRVFIDRVPGDPAGDFVTVDDCERVTRQLQHVLEVEGLDYERLEVSSPGLDRPLKKPADWLRFAGEQIDLTLREAFQGRKRWRGRLQALEGSGFRLELADAAGERALDFTLDEVREARLVPVVDFKGRRAAGGLAAAPAAVDGGKNE